MRFLAHLIAFGRSQQLGRQLDQIERSIQALPNESRSRLGVLTLREIGQAARSEFPHLYGTPPQDRYALWGRGASVGYARARSENPEIALRGIALWLAVAYHEIKDTHYPALQQARRRLLRVVRELKELHGAGGKEARREEPATDEWITRATA